MLIGCPIVAVVALVAALLTQSATGGHPTEAAGARFQLPLARTELEGTLLPDLPVRDRSYAPASLPALKGTATVLTFWATWCSPCVAEMPVFKKLQDAYNGRLHIAPIAVQDSRLNIDQWIAKNPQYDFLFLMDGNLGQVKTPLERYFWIQGIPVTVFVAADGRIASIWVGFAGEAALIAKVNALMGR